MKTTTLGCREKRQREKRREGIRCSSWEERDKYPTKISAGIGSGALFSLGEITNLSASTGVRMHSGGAHWSSFAFTLAQATAAETEQQTGIISNGRGTAVSFLLVWELCRTFINYFVRENVILEKEVSDVISFNTCFGKIDGVTHPQCPFCTVKWTAQINSGTRWGWPRANRVDSSC